MSLRHKYKQQTRETLLQAVLERTASGQSFSSLNMHQVTKLAGIVPTAFYRHFSDMEALGKELVESHLSIALSDLRERVMLSEIESYQEQIRLSVTVFFEMVDTHPNYWHFIVTERWGGSPAVCAALKKQMDNFVQQLGKDLGLLPAFKHLSKQDRHMLADVGINLFLSWVIDWLDIPNHVKPRKNQTVEAATSAAKQKHIDYCTQQTRLVFYGVANWKPRGSSGKPTE